MSHSYPCLVCGIATFFWCSRCRNAWYCSSGHSHGDWKNHRKECHPALAYRLNMIAIPPQAEPQYLSVEAIFFLADEERPKICTVRCRPPERPSHAVCLLPLLQQYFEAQPHNIPRQNRGNAIVLKFNGACRQGYTDAGSNDLPALSAYFLSLSDQ
ncbi:hypothetical protein B0H14DRAFT_3082423 [Mycena olivaceomarginata]|nr:hypothetical protein B0H14DRAFT_3082423 [Mycena olivaceomarginata]